METSIRRIGNSLGVIIPRAALEEWGLGEGDALVVDRAGIRPKSGATPEVLDRLKHALALETVRSFSARQIRAKILANLHRWKASGAWVSAYDEWKSIAESGDDGALYAAMIGQDENANRLRQSMPFVGLLPRDEVRRLNEEATR